MIIELYCILGIIAFLALLIKERDWLYVLSFGVGFLAAIIIEPRGIIENLWTYQNIAWPFSYLLFGVPVCLYLIYASGAAVTYFLINSFIKFRKEHDKYDNKFAYAFILIGAFISLLSLILPLHLYLGLILIMAGIYLLVKDPVMFYIGGVVLIVDIVIEHFIIFTNQITYTFSPWDAGVGFFLGGAIFAGAIIFYKKHLKKPNASPKK